jgi:RNA polymerase sigma-70 factor (ECF subfamily)
MTNADESKVPSDEELIRELASGRREAIGPLYARYAPLLFGMAAHALDHATAEEVVQDVFLAVWKSAASFDPARGPVRPWLFQIAHFRIANELRHRSRRPRTEADPKGTILASVPDPGPDQAERAWGEHRRSALRSAFEQLPPPQRQALGLAFFEDLTHGEIAAALKLPLGTAKSRVRAGLRNLRTKLAPLVATLAVVALLAGLTIRLETRRQALARDERALAMLTASDSEALRLSAAPGVPETTHGVYRSRPGAPIAVMTFSNFDPAPPGRVYQAWARHGAVWISLGTALPDSAGRARLIAEGTSLSLRPDAVEVTVEPPGGSASPGGPVVVSWGKLRVES